jgi:hypothetical protein
LWKSWLSSFLGSGFSDDEEILITLSYGKRCVRSQEFMAKDLGQEDVVGLVSWFEHVAAGTSFEPYPIPVLADSKKIIQALDRLRDLKTFASAASSVGAAEVARFPWFVQRAEGGGNVLRQLRGRWWC